jgi:hypothetical protein
LQFDSVDDVLFLSPESLFRIGVDHVHLQMKNNVTHQATHVRDCAVVGMSCVESGDACF